MECSRKQSSPDSPKAGQKKDPRPEACDAEAPLPALVPHPVLGGRTCMRGGACHKPNYKGTRTCGWGKAWLQWLLSYLLRGKICIEKGGRPGEHRHSALVAH